MWFRTEQLLADEKLLPGDRDLIPYFRIVDSGVKLHELHKAVKKGVPRENRLMRKIFLAVPEWEVIEAVVPKFPLTVTYLRENHDTVCFRKWPRNQKPSWWDKLLAELSFPRKEWEFAKITLQVWLLDVVTLTNQHIPMDEAFLLIFTKLVHVLEDTYEEKNFQPSRERVREDWQKISTDVRVLDVINHFCDLVRGLLAPPLSPEKALSELQREAGIHYDPDVVEALADYQKNSFSEELAYYGPEKFFRSHRVTPLFKSVFIRYLVNVDSKKYVALGQRSPFQKIIQDYMALRDKGVWTPEEYHLMQEEACVKYLVDPYLPEGSRWKKEYRQAILLFKHLHGQEPLSKEELEKIPAAGLEIFQILHDYDRRIHGHDGFSPRPREQALREIQALEGKPYSPKLLQAFLKLVEEVGENFYCCYQSDND